MYVKDIHIYIYIYRYRYRYIDIKFISFLCTRCYNYVHQKGYNMCMTMKKIVLLPIIFIYHIYTISGIIEKEVVCLGNI